MTDSISRTKSPFGNVNKNSECDAKTGRESYLEVEKAAIKQEDSPDEYCVICCSVTDDYLDIFVAETKYSRSLISCYISKITDLALESNNLNCRSICKTCYDLVIQIDIAEFSFSRLKNSFLNLLDNNTFLKARCLSKKTVFTQTCDQLDLSDKSLAVHPITVPVEFSFKSEDSENSDDEPLSQARKKRKKEKKRKKIERKPQKGKMNVDIVKDEKCTVLEFDSEKDKCNECPETFESRMLADAHAKILHQTDVLLEPNVVSKLGECEVKSEDIETMKSGRPKRNTVKEVTKEEEDDDFFIPDYDDRNSDSDTDWAIGEVPVKDESSNGKPKKVVAKKENTQIISQLKSNSVTIKVLQKPNPTSKIAIKTEDILAVKLDKKPAKPKWKKPPVTHKCPECPAELTSKARLAFHMTKHDGSKPPYICEICGASYKHKKACDVHVQMHKGISPWKCNECDKIFPSKGALQRHEAIHTGKPNYQCDLCGKSFIHTSSFKMHKLSHTGLKPHACDVCGLALMTRSHLKRHKRVHSGEKRHECQHCGKKFSERYNLIAHMKSHGSTTESLGVKPRSRMFRCSLCDSGFERKYLLEKHMDTVHHRIAEKGPPKPRNTMTKLLKMRAADGTLGKPGLPLTTEALLKQLPLAGPSLGGKAEIPPDSSALVGSGGPIAETDVALKRSPRDSPTITPNSTSVGPNVLSEPPASYAPQPGPTWPPHLQDFSAAPRMHAADYLSYITRQS